MGVFLLAVGLFVLAVVSDRLLATPETCANGIKLTTCTVHLQETKASGNPVGTNGRPVGTSGNPGGTKDNLVDSTGEVASLRKH